LYPHHEEGIWKYTEKIKKEKEVQAIIIGGSIAHGFETEKSDIDVMVLVSDEEYKRRLDSSTIQFLDKDVGHIDGKYISSEFLNNAIKIGNEATRYAFKGAFITYSRIEGLEEIISEIQKYPIKEKQEKINRFYAQFKAWNYYCKYAYKNNDMYLLNYAVTNLVYFGGRLILAHNETLFPYHKWFMRALENVSEKPVGLTDTIKMLLEKRQKEDMEAFYNMINDYRQWDDSGTSWPNVFFHDSEYNWISGNPPVADL